MSKASPEAYAAALEHYERLVATIPDLKRKGAANPYTSLNGNMFSFLSQDGRVSLRMSDADREAFIRRHGGGPSIQWGAVMRGYVEVPPSVLPKFAVMKRAFARSYEYATTLPAKPTTKKKAGAKKAGAKKKGSQKKATAKRTTEKRVAKEPASKKKAAKKSATKKSIATKAATEPGSKRATSRQPAARKKAATKRKPAAKKTGTRKKASR